MSGRFSWSKEQRENAKARGKGLFAVAVEADGGRYSLWGPMDKAKANLLFRFAAAFHLGASPEEALAKAMEPGPGEAAAKTKGDAR
jgi:hypothetical protein